MKIAIAQEIVSGLKEAGITFVCYLPDSWLKEVYQLVTEDPHFQAVLVTNEGEGVAVCAGAWLGGKGAAMIMENSGLRVASEALARLGLGHGIPVFLVMSYRGDLGDRDWWAQPHGWTTEPMLQALRIPYRVMRRPEEIRSVMALAQDTLDSSKLPVAVLVGRELCL
ncbi:MAG: sulfopyruvate decarboxylase [Chloroflexi bacterium]|nr:sulfopyruvate decarboxylase [Chloroflexota bacterium]